jgi:hypothetical protein
MSGGKPPLRLAAQKSRLHAPSVPMSAGGRRRRPWTSVAPPVAAVLPRFWRRPPYCFTRPCTTAAAVTPGPQRRHLQRQLQPRSVLVPGSDSDVDHFRCECSCGGSSAWAFSPRAPTPSWRARRRRTSERRNIQREAALAPFWARRGAWPPVGLSERLWRSRWLRRRERIGGMREALPHGAPHHVRLRRRRLGGPRASLRP